MAIGIRQRGSDQYMPITHPTDAAWVFCLATKLAPCFYCQSRPNVIIHKRTHSNEQWFEPGVLPPLPEHGGCPFCRGIPGCASKHTRK
jgi:hypothetical protein